MIVQIILLFILILINGVFAASEIAFLSVDKVKLSQDLKKNNKKANLVKKLLDNTSGFLATIQIGITLAGFLASAFAAEAFADNIVGYLSFLTVSEAVLKPIIVIIVTIILSYFTLVFGELVPKKLALKYPEKIAYSMANFIYVLSKITYPFVVLLTKSTNLCVKLFGVKEDHSEGKITEEQIKLMIAEGKDTGAIEPAEKDLIYNIFKFNDIKIKDIMTPIEKTYSIEVSKSAKEIMSIIRKEKYTRYPVYIEDVNNIIGIFNVKDIIITHLKNTKFDIKKFINTPFYVFENENIDDVFKKMQDKRQMMSIVMKDEDTVSGIVTVEDLVEEIVGNIFDEYDEENI